MVEILRLENIITGCRPCPYEDAIRRCGEMLVSGGYVNERYIEGMLVREHSFPTSIGNKIAIPHGEKEYKEEILQTGVVVLTYPQGIEWNDETVKLVIGIAARGNEHLDILERIVEALSTEEMVEDLVESANPERIHRMFAPGGMVR